MSMNLLSSMQLGLRSLALLFCGALAAGAHAVPVNITVLDASGTPQPDAAVSIEVRGTPTVAAPGTRADLAQRQRAFEPRLLIVQTGTAVSFPNFDTVRHHVYSFSPAKPFEIKLYAGTPAAPVVFDTPGTAILGCNIHDRMTAYVHVVSTPHFAKTRADGIATLDVPAGQHTVQVWHPMHGDKGQPRRQPITVPASGSTFTSIKLGAN